MNPDQGQLGRLWRRMVGLTCVRIAGQSHDETRQKPLIRSHGDRSAASDLKLHQAAVWGN